MVLKLEEMVLNLIICAIYNNEIIKKFVAKEIENRFNLYDISIYRLSYGKLLKLIRYYFETYIGFRESKISSNRGHLVVLFIMD